MYFRDAIRSCNETCMKVCINVSCTDHVICSGLFPLSGGIGLGVWGMLGPRI